MTTAFDLDAYLHRTGAEAGPPDVATLARLIARHQQAIPFENIEVLAGRVPPLDLDALQRKLVHSRRGGYCFEQNTLFMAVLRALGFEVRGLEGRVRAGVPADVATARTHMALAVRIAGEDWLADVGFGTLAPPVPLKLGVSDAAGEGDTHRIVAAEHGALMLQARSFEGWLDGYLILPSRPQAIDYEMGNWWTATHPGAMLRRKLLVARSLPDGGRLTLFDHQLSLRRPLDAVPQTRELTGRDEIAAVLAGDFGLEIAAADLDAVMRRLAEAAAAGATSA